MTGQPICGRCHKVMTRENATIHPEYFLHDDCLPDDMKPAPKKVPGCPVCVIDMKKHFRETEFIWLCTTCGAATWEEGASYYVPTQALQYQRLREAAGPIVTLLEYWDVEFPLSKYPGRENFKINDLAGDATVSDLRHLRAALAESKGE